MPGIVTISNPQTRVKDVYAPAPKIDLTLRANGEEAVLVMNSLAQWTRAGLEAPPTAPTVVSLGTVATFTANKYWSYAYVYVAKRLYPLVENAVTGGGSPAPRSNPSPISAADSTVNTNAKRLDIPTSQRYDISHIWVYRTTYFDTAPEAADFGAAGNLFWIGEVENNSNIATVPFVDNAAAQGLEQIENDNFMSPQFDKCVYADPFFWGFGNLIFEPAVSVTTTGLVTLTTAGDKWYDGRNGQIISFDGITSGGFDGHGSFYFKQIDNTTAQLYQDIALTSTIGLSVNGTTIAHLRGPSTVLYRSKPRNPFSWGQTDLIGDVQVPELYTFSVGGGNGTAIAVIPNLNLLKLDTESPNKCYTLNLKNAGTPNFESSLRAIADNYCVSNHHSQFSAILDKGQNVLWGIDSKGFAIVECDSASQQPISSMVYKTLRNLSKNAHDRLFFHGCYCPRGELNCLFVRTDDTTSTSFNKMIYQHGPTGLWGTMDVSDVLCSSQIFDRFSGQMKMFVGTETGLVGEFFAEGQVCHWFDSVHAESDMGHQYGTGFLQQSFIGSQMVLLPGNPTFKNFLTGNVFDGVIGNWVTIHHNFNNAANPNREIWRCRISGVSADGVTVTFDRCLQYNSNTGDWNDAFYTTVIPGIAANAIFYLGLIEMEVGRTFNAAVPFDTKKVDELWSTWYINGHKNMDPTIEHFSGYIHISGGMTQSDMILAGGNSFALDANTRVIDEPFVYQTPSPLPITYARQQGFVMRDRNYAQVQLMNYELRLNDADGNNN